MTHKNNMANEFKVGDRVRVENWGAQFSTYDTKAKELGLTKWKPDHKNDYFLHDRKDIHGTVVAQIDEYVGVELDDGHQHVIGSRGLVLIAAKKMKRPANYVLQYERDIDPFEVFSTEKELRARIAELAALPDLKHDSLKVYDIKRTRTVTLGVKITIK